MKSNLSKGENRVASSISWKARKAFLKLKPDIANKNENHDIFIPKHTVGDLLERPEAVFLHTHRGFWQGGGGVTLGVDTSHRVNTQIVMMLKNSWQFVYCNYLLSCLAEGRNTTHTFFSNCSPSIFPFPFSWSQCACVYLPRPPTLPSLPSLHSCLPRLMKARGPYFFAFFQTHWLSLLSSHSKPQLHWYVHQSAGHSPISLYSCLYTDAASLSWMCASCHLEVHP